MTISIQKTAPKKSLAVVIVGLDSSLKTAMKSPAISKWRSKITQVPHLAKTLFKK